MRSKASVLFGVSFWFSQRGLAWCEDYGLAGYDLMVLWNSYGSWVHEPFALFAAPTVRFALKRRMGISGAKDRTYGSI